MPHAQTHPDAERIAAIRDIAADVFSVEPAQVESAADFVRDLEADSLLAIELLAQLEKRFDIVIDDAQLPRMTDLAATYAVVAECAGWAHR